MTRLEQVAGGERFDSDLNHRAGRHHFGFFPGVAITATQDAVAQVHRVAARVVFVGRIHIDQLGGEIGVDAIRRYMQLDRDRPCDGDVVRKRRRLEHQHIGARGERHAGIFTAEESLVFALIERAALEHRLAGSERPAHGRHRI